MVTVKVPVVKVVTPAVPSRVASINLKLDVVEPAQIESYETPRNLPNSILSQTSLTPLAFQSGVGHGPTMLEPEVPEEVMAGDMPTIIITLD